MLVDGFVWSIGRHMSPARHKSHQQPAGISAPCLAIAMSDCADAHTAPGSQKQRGLPALDGVLAADAEGWQPLAIYMLCIKRDLRHLSNNDGP